MSEKEIPVLVVDLDGTLIKTDLLYESFFSVLGLSLKVLVFALISLIKGKAALKSYLQSVSNIDVKLLPYDEIICAYIRDHRARGGRVILATASHHIFAQDVHIISLHNYLRALRRLLVLAVTIWR